MLVLAGLGNPGERHANNRHNVGFMAADAIHRRHSFSPWSKKFQALVSEGRLGGDKVLLIKPQTWMNLSGQAVGEALRFYKLEPADVTAFYDELDLAPGKVRVKRGGGAGGHNGIRSLDGHLGQEYRRVRIGIGHPGVKEFVMPHVLGDFAKADHEWLDPLLDALADNAAMLVEGDENGFMNRLSLAVPGAAKPPRRKAGDVEGGPPDEAPKPRREAGKAEDGPPDETPKPAQKGQSHIRQARPKSPAIKVPESGPMAAMLKRLFGKD